MSDGSMFSVDDVVVFGADGEPRILDVRLAEALGYARLRIVRDLISRHEPEISLYGCIVRVDLSSEAPRGAAVPAEADTGFWLNEGQALIVAALSRTPVAAQVRQQAYHGRLATAAVPAQLSISGPAERSRKARRLRNQIEYVTAQQLGLATRLGRLTAEFESLARTELSERPLSGPRLIGADWQNVPEKRLAAPTKPTEAGAPSRGPVKPREPT